MKDYILSSDRLEAEHRSRNRLGAFICLIIFCAGVATGYFLGATA